MSGIISRADWGFDGWNGSPFAVGAGVRELTVDHWEGGPTGYATGAGAIRAIHAQHKNQGWAGIGYNFVVTNDGQKWEGRGWNLVGAHCPKFNRNGIGVQVHIGQGESASNAALTAVAEIHQENIARAGHGIGTKGHSDGYSTECPGAQLLAWAHAGMNSPGGGPVYSPPPPIFTVHGSVSLPELVAAAHSDSARPQGQGTPGSEDDVLIVESALVAEGLLSRALLDGSFGSSSVSAYKQWQTRLGYSGADADGIPGLKSLQALGAKYGFGVYGNVAGQPGPTPPPPPPAPARARVSLSQLVESARQDGPAPQGWAAHRGNALIVEQALAAVGQNPGPVDGSFGTSAVRAYAAFQRSLGYAGKDADGIPGQKSLAALGQRAGFDVVP